MSRAQSLARQKMLTGPGHLYAAYSRYCDWIKVGFTSKPVAERIEAINRQYAAFGPFTLIGSTRSLWAAEQQIHSWFRPFRQRNRGLTAELYPAAPALLKAIKQIIANRDWPGLEYPQSSIMREWSRKAAAHPINRAESVICFDRYHAECALRDAEASAFLDRRVAA